MRTIIEPFKIKMVEPIRVTTEEERERVLAEAGYNLFNVHSQDVLIDLLTDSGTSAMSAEQWAKMISGDEAYAGSRSYYAFEEVVQSITGLGHIIPTHQGRAAERILFSLMVEPGKVVFNNTHFDTTRANIEHERGIATDLVIPEGHDPTSIHPFKGNMDVARLDAAIAEVGPEHVPLVMVTVTNNAAGGQPVSMANIKAVRAVCDKYGIPLFLDACRFAENAWFIKLREDGYADVPLVDIAHEMFSYADGCTMSAKKDAFANIGGFLALNDDELAMRVKSLLIITEGFTTYGGLAGRDLGAIAQGLTEVLDEDYMRYRIRSTAYLGEGLKSVGVPIVEPPGGHAIYVDAKGMLPHLPRAQLPGQSLCVELFRKAGVRAVEIGSVMFATMDDDGTMHYPDLELVRLAIPRRVYTQSHVDYLIEAFDEINQHKDSIRGLTFRYRAPVLPHFTSTFEPV